MTQATLFHMGVKLGKLIDTALLIACKTCNVGTARGDLFDNVFKHR